MNTRPVGSWIAQDEQANPIGHRLLEFVPVDARTTVERAGQGHFATFARALNGERSDGRVDGGLNEDGVSFLREATTRHVERLHDVRDEQDVPGRNGPSVEPRQPFDQRIHELARGSAVAEHAVIDPAAQRPKDRLRGCEFHVRDPERKDIRRIPSPLDTVGRPAVYLAVEVVRHGYRKLGEWVETARAPTNARERERSPVGFPDAPGVPAPVSLAFGSLKPALLEAARVVVLHPLHPRQRFAAVVHDKGCERPRQAAQRRR